MTTTAPTPASTEAADTALSFLYLDEPAMIAAGVTDMAQCIDTMEEMFKCLGNEDFRMAGETNSSHGSMIRFPEHPVHPGMPKDGDDRRFMAMPAYLGGPFQTTGLKWYGSNMDNRGVGLPRSIHLVIINDKDTGAPLALMSGNLLSAYRTGAIPGVGARYFARPDSKTVGIIGPGVMGKTSLDAFMAACPNITTLKIKGRGKTSLAAFINWAHEKYPQLRIDAVDTLEEAVRGCDIVCPAQTGGTGAATYPKIETEWIEPGTLIAAPSYFTADDDFLADPATRLIADSKGLYEAWAEESDFPHHDYLGIIGNRYMDLIEMGRIDMSRIDDLPEVLTGKKPARKSDDEIVVLSVGGMPVEDVAWGTTLYRNALELGIGQRLSLWDAPEMA